MRLFFLAALLLAVTPVWAEPFLLEDMTPVKLSSPMEISLKNLGDGDIIELTVAQDVYDAAGQTVLIARGTPAVAVVSTSSDIRGVNLNNGNFKYRDSLYIHPLKVKTVFNTMIPLQGQVSRQEQRANAGKLATAAVIGPLFPPAFFLMKSEKPKIRAGEQISAFTKGSWKIETAEDPTP